MDPLQHFGLQGLDDWKLSGPSPASGISPRVSQPSTPPASLQRMAGDALLRIVPRLALPIKVINAGPTAPGTLDEARRRGWL